MPWRPERINEEVYPLNDLLSRSWSSAPAMDAAQVEPPARVDTRPRPAFAQDGDFLDARQRDDRHVRLEQGADLVARGPAGHRIVVRQAPDEQAVEARAGVVPAQVPAPARGQPPVEEHRRQPVEVAARGRAPRDD